MYKIILDCDLMRFKDSGLYHYCLNLGTHVKRVLDVAQEGHMSFYVPPAEKHVFGQDAGFIIEKKWHEKFVKPFLWDCDIWHAPFQSGRILPKKNGRKNVKPSVVAVLPMSAASFQSGTGTLAAYLQSTPRK